MVFREPFVFLLEFVGLRKEDWLRVGVVSLLFLNSGMVIFLLERRAEYLTLNHVKFVIFHILYLS